MLHEGSSPAASSPGHGLAAHATTKTQLDTAGASTKGSTGVSRTSCKVYILTYHALTANAGPKSKKAGRAGGPDSNPDRQNGRPQSEHAHPSPSATLPLTSKKFTRLYTAPHLPHPEGGGKARPRSRRALWNRSATASSRCFRACTDGSGDRAGRDDTAVSRCRCWAPCEGVDAKWVAAGS